jgi:hypothetical protein
MGRAQQPSQSTLGDPPLPFARQDKVKVTRPGRGESGTWIVLGWVTSSGLEDPAYDVRHERRGQPRIFRSSRLVLATKPRASRPQRKQAASGDGDSARQEAIPL